MKNHKILGVVKVPPKLKMRVKIRNHLRPWSNEAKEEVHKDIRRRTFRHPRDREVVSDGP